MGTWSPMEVRIKGEAVRFAPESKKLGTLGKRKRLLLPDARAELSVTRTNCLNCEDILDEGLKFVEKHGTASELHGWLEFNEEAATEAALRIDYDCEPPRHANVRGWPVSEEPGERRQKQLEAAEKLAELCYREAVFDPPIKPQARPEPGLACENVKMI